MRETTKTIKRKLVVKPKVKSLCEVETYRSIKDGEVKLTAVEKKKAELLTKALGE